MIFTIQKRINFRSLKDVINKTDVAFYKATSVLFVVNVYTKI